MTPVALAAPLVVALADSVDSANVSFYNNVSNINYEADNQADEFVDFYSSMTIAELRDKSLELMDAGHYTDAIASIHQLQGAIHRLYGVDTIEQVESLIWLIECYGKLNQFNRVDQQQEFLFSLAARTLNEQDPRFQYARLRLANWYLRSLRYERALMLYDVVGEWAEKGLPANTGEQQEILLMSLRGEALARYVSGMCCASKPMLRVHQITSESGDFDIEHKQSALQDYVNILFLERNHGDASPLLQSLAESHDAMSPVLLGFSKPGDMAIAVNRARHLSTGHVTSYKASKRHNAIAFNSAPDLPIVLGDPISICGDQIQTLVQGRNRRRLATLYVDVSMRIDKKGRATDVQMTGNTTSKVRRYLAQAIRKIRFRPGVSTTGEIDDVRLEFRQVFTTAAAPSRFRDVSSWSRVLASHNCQISAL
ncbi:MAG: hypothetical protein ACI8PP_001580 [Candidatus Pseudothioglobus sp.]|jgi:hypothetical protein